MPPQKGHRAPHGRLSGGCSASAPEVAGAAVLPGRSLLPEWQFATIVGYISEIVSFPMTENIKF